MRSRLVPAVLSLALLGSVGRELGAQGRGQDTRPGSAVLPFDNSGSDGQDKENFDALQKGIAGMLIQMPDSFPMALGVIYEDPAPTFEAAVREQNQAAASGKAADLQALVSKGQTWMVEKEPHKL